MAKTIAILGAGGVGKSELTDRLAMIEGKRPAPGEQHEMRVVEFPFMGESWTAFDCPGSLEFLQQSADALLGADMAVIVADPDPEHAVLTAPFLRLVEQAGVPAMIFINRMDQASNRARDMVAALQGFSTHPVVLRQIPMRRDGKIVGAVDLVSERAWRYNADGPSDLVEIPSDLADREAEARGDFLENLSEYDDWLLEELIEDRVPAGAEIYGICARTVGSGTVTPAFIGVAANGNGVFRLLKALRHETPGVEALSERMGGADAVSFLVRHRKHVGKTTWLRALAPISGGQVLGGAPLGPLSIVQGDGSESTASVAPGQVFTAIKSDHLATARPYSGEELVAPDWHRPLPPQLRHAVVPQNDKDDARLSEAIGKLVAEDLSLTAEHDDETGSHVLAGQGTLHLRRARQLLEDGYGVPTDERPVTPALRETITRPVDVHYRHKKQSGGAGQFADVKMTVGPVARGEGFRFEQTIHGGSVPKNYIPAVEAGAQDATDRGPLGFPVVDIAVTLTDGQAHSVDSSDMAFRIAARSGVRQALEEAGSVLLEPIYAVTFAVPSQFTGALNPLVASRRGQVLGFDRSGEAEGWDEFRALLPGGALDDLIADLRSVTQGVGRFEAKFEHYQELYGRDADLLIESRAKVLEVA